MRHLNIIKESISLDGVGQVDITWDFDVDEYKEYLQDAGLEDTQEELREYIENNVTFELEYFDNDTYHHMDWGSEMYDGLVEAFGEKMTDRIIQELMSDGQSSFETSELYNSHGYDVNNQDDLNSIAMKILNHGGYYKGCRGFILSNGVIVYTPAEHNMVSQISGVNGTFDFIRRGNIRILNQSIDLSTRPTQEQEQTLREVISSYADEELYMDIMTGDGSIGVHYSRPNWRRVLGDIRAYFDEGIKPIGGSSMYQESKNMKNIIISESQYNRLFLKRSD
jgi:hypothetical protein